MGNQLWQQPQDYRQEAEAPNQTGDLGGKQERDPVEALLRGNNQTFFKIITNNRRNPGTSVRKTLEPGNSDF